MISDSLNEHGLTLLSQNQYETAESFFREAIVHDPGHADAHSNLGVALFMQDKFADATAVLQQACHLRPDDATTLVNYGHSLWYSGAVHEAREVFLRAATSMPQLHAEIARLCWHLGDVDGVCHHATTALQQASPSLNRKVLHNLLSEIYRLRGDKAAALAEADIMLDLDPSSGYNRSLIMISLGEKAGWAEHEKFYPERGRRGVLMQQRHQQPWWFCKLLNSKWEGQPTKHLFVSGEQGVGDIMQYLRYVPLAAERCEKLTLFLPESLHRLAELSFNQQNIEIISDKLPKTFDHYCLIMSLEYLLDRLDDPLPPPYLVAPVGYAEIDRLAGTKVGLVWAGRKEHSEDRWRSMTVEHLTPLFSLPYTFVSVQFPCDVKHDRLVQPQAPTDWADTAALISHLDLVISVDTSVAHLAGALGKPVWMLNRYNTDWRWGLKRSDSVWYPSMRIFRQPTMGDWGSVIERVRQELAGL